MLFNSIEYLLIFLPLVTIFYFIKSIKKKIKFRIFFLILVSLFFYAYWELKYIFLILISIITNYYFSKIISISPKKKLYFLFIILFNVILLFYFKYYNFFVENFNLLFGISLSSKNIILPLAISFFTLQQISFQFDNYYKEVKKTSFLKYFFFVTFFPQLIAGPIVRYNQLVSQFNLVSIFKLDYKNIYNGLFFLSCGLFKKLIIADNLGIYVDYFHDQDSYNLIQAWFCSVAFFFQIYFDFSGYSEMAIGSAMILNIKLPYNFLSPFKAKNIIDFWQNWHITLTKFIENYIFYNLIRINKDPTFLYYIFALIITFIIAGIWHGSSWQFAIFGLINGVGLAVNHFCRRKNININKIVSIFLWFNVLNISFVFFRSEKLSKAIEIIKAMFNFSNIHLPNQLENILGLKNFFTYTNTWFGMDISSIKGILLIVICSIIVFKFKNVKELNNDLTINRKFYYILSGFTLSFLAINTVQSFIYFNF